MRFGAQVSEVVSAMFPCGLLRQKMSENALSVTLAPPMPGYDTSKFRSLFRPVCEEGYHVSS